MATITVDSSYVNLVYRDANGVSHTQPLNDLGEVGILIDDNEDDMDIIGVTVVTTPQ